MAKVTKKVATDPVVGTKWVDSEEATTTVLAVAGGFVMHQRAFQIATCASTEQFLKTFSPCK